MSKEVERLRLLAEASKLLESQGRLPSGRKSRSDKGKPREKYDKQPTKSNMWKYEMVKSKLLNKMYNDEDGMYTIEYDENGYYLPIEEKFKAEYGQFGTRNVKYKRIQKSVDLEEYRFNAWYEMATGVNQYCKVPVDNKDLMTWGIRTGGLTREEATEYFKRKNYTWKELFCEFYHIEEYELHMWTYSLWKEHYDRTPKYELPTEFKFTINSMPGTQMFMPEWSYVAEQNEQNKRQEENDNHAKRVWNGKISKSKK